MPESRPTRRALTKADGPGAYFGETPHASNDRDLRWGGGRVADDDARVTGVGSVGRRGVEPDDRVDGVGSNELAAGSADSVIAS